MGRDKILTLRSRLTVIPARSLFRAMCRPFPWISAFHRARIKIGWMSMV